MLFATFPQMTPWPADRVPVQVVFCLQVLLSYRQVASVAIDNDIMGEPDIECLDEEIRVWVKTRKLFAGRIYAKGRADVPECNKDDYAGQRTDKPHFDLKFGACGMKSLRSVRLLSLIRFTIW